MVMESLQRLDPPRQLGKMTLLARLGEGGMASVYVAAVGDGPLARLAAVKLVRSGAPDHDYRTRFLDEARVVVRLHHNNLVDVREAGEVDDQLYILMELIEGRDLSDVWNRCAEKGRAFPVPIAVHLVREILRGLHYAHTFPGLALVHRDVSPSNILIDWAGAVRLADFGLATSSMKAAQTVAGLVFGKVGYMAPEQATRGDLDGRADVYGCGVVLWELLTGRPLRDSEADTRTVAGFEAPPPSTLSKRVDPQLDAIVRRALANDPDLRHADAQSLLRALSEWLAEHAPQTNQETVAAFMGELFGDARQRDHAAFTKLLEDLPRTGVWDRTGRRIDTASGASGARQGRGDSPTSTTEEIRGGVVLAERYRVERKLGRGGMGTVYLAEHLTVGRKVALKVLTHEWSRHEVVARRFREEARAASAAGHPNIVEVFDAGTLDDGRLYLVMEYLTGRSLYDELVEVGPMSVERVCRIIREVARAVEAAHEVGIIHRDLKPDNVMLVRRGDEEVVKVLDFGISASAVRSAEEQRLTQPGHCLGTPEYMAPEQARGHDPAPTFDVYALGVLMYEALCGQAPFESDNMVEVLTRKATEAAPPLLHHRPDAPPALAKLVHRCIEIDPLRRPQTMSAVLQALAPIADALTAGLPVPGSLSSRGFEQALDAAAAGSTVYRSAPSPAAPVGAAKGTSVPVPLPRKGSVSDVVPAARRRRLLVGLSAGLSALVMGVLWWRLLPAGTEQPIDGDSIGSAAAQRQSSAEQVSQQQVVDLETSSVDPEPAPSGPNPSRGSEPRAVDVEESDQQRLDTATAEPRDAHEATAEPPSETSSSKARSRRRSQEDCDARQREAKAAFAKRDFAGALAKLNKARCWRGAARKQYLRMRVESLFQTRAYAQCVREGQGSTDPTVQEKVSICRRKG